MLQNFSRPVSRETSCFMLKKLSMASHVRMNQFQFWAVLRQVILVCPVSALSAKVILLGAMALGSFLLPAAAAQNIPPITMSEADGGVSENKPVIVRTANFGQEESSPESRKLAAWVMDSADNGKLPFIIIDKARARVFVFDGEGQLRGTSAALLGLAVGDDSVPGIGQRKLSSIRPEERTTPAGRFVASLDLDVHGKEILWVDYDTSVSLHRVALGQPKERRAERLASPSLLDKRITYGCINVPARFYEKVVSPTFTGTKGIVYVLPETRSAREVFGLYDVQESSRKQLAPEPVQASN